MLVNLITSIPFDQQSAAFLFLLSSVSMLAVSRLWKGATKNTPEQKTPTCVNYHITRQCNYKCGFCYHTARTSEVAKLDDAKKVLQKLKDAGMQKINFAGGEPFLQPKFLEQLCDFCHNTLKVGVTIVSNGSKIKRSWLLRNRDNIDILAVSCDSFKDETNELIGRSDGSHRSQRQVVTEVAHMCHELGIPFKLNTVVNAHNYMEDMSEGLEDLGLIKRWKVFQCLEIAGENSGREGDLRNVKEFLVTTEQFDAFCERHKRFLPVAEGNDLMRNSYLILDEKLRFLNCSEGGKTPSQSLLDVTVAEAIAQSGYDDESFRQRGGIFDWKKPETPAHTSATEQKERVDEGQSVCSRTDLDW